MLNLMTHSWESQDFFFFLRWNASKVLISRTTKLCKKVLFNWYLCDGQYLELALKNIYKQTIQKALGLNGISVLYIVMYKNLGWEDGNVCQGQNTAVWMLSKYFICYFHWCWYTEEEEEKKNVLNKVLPKPTSNRIAFSIKDVIAFYPAVPVFNMLFFIYFLLYRNRSTAVSPKMKVSAQCTCVMHSE